MTVGSLIVACAFSANAAADCSRTSLQALTDAYVKAQAAGDVSKLGFAKGATYAENDKVMDAKQGVLAGPLKIDFTRSFHDTKQCATFTEVTAATDPHPYVIHTRIEATPDGKQVQKMESMVTDAGDWVFGAAEHLAVTKTEKWDEIPKDKRDTREAIQAAADAYLNNWGDPALPVPHGTPCSRLEGRISTAAKDPAGQQCTMGAFPEKLNVTNRRYVIDETMGAVSIFHKFPWLDAGIPKDPGTPASQSFRVEGGKNRYIHEVTVCTSPGCGRGRPPGPPPAAQPAPAAPASK
jgi:hypothetical protein